MLTFASLAATFDELERTSSRGALVQRLAELLDQASAEAILQRLGGQVHAQSKFDGMRLQIHLDRDQPNGQQVRLFSRNLEDMTAMFPEIVDGVLAQVAGQSAILDAEVLADEITRSPIHTAGRGDESNGYALRFPRFVRLRESDKRPEDATTVRELVELYRAQRERA